MTDRAIYRIFEFTPQSCYWLESSESHSVCLLGGDWFWATMEVWRKQRNEKKNHKWRTRGSNLLSDRSLPASSSLKTFFFCLGRKANLGHNCFVYGMFLHKNEHWGESHTVGPAQSPRLTVCPEGPLEALPSQVCGREQRQWAPH